MGSKFFPLKVAPKFEVIIGAPLKEKKCFFDISEGMENCEKSGKNQGKVREFRGG